jgi:hypothetical protein
MQARKTNNHGCLWTVIVVALSFVAFGLLSVIGFPSLFAAISGSIIAAVFTSVLIGKPRKGFLWGSAFFYFATILVLKFVFGFIVDAFETTKSPTFNKPEQVAKSTIIENNDTILVYSSKRVWKDNFGNDFDANLTVREADYLQLYKHLEHYKGSSSGNFWGNLYDYLDQQDTPKLDLVLKAFSEIQAAKNLNQMEFAEMVVTCIQDIPYSLVFEGECLSPENYEYEIQQILKECPDCCVGDVKFGVQNPVTFLQSLKGDCDSRTVLIYAILKHFGYDIAILNSDYYRHSILGINIPGGGTYKTHYGKRYLLWETTNKYFKAGDVPSTFNDVSYWNVVLTSK